MVPALDLTVAAANGGMDGLVGLPVEVAGEAEGRFATGAGEAGCLAGVLLEIRRFVHGFRF